MRSPAFGSTGVARFAALATALLMSVVSGPSPAAVGEPARDSTLAALERARATVVGVQVTAIESARSAETLGRERQGSGVVIGDAVGFEDEIADGEHHAVVADDDP